MHMLRMTIVSILVLLLERIHYIHWKTVDEKSTRRLLNVGEDDIYIGTPKEMGIQGKDGKEGYKTFPTSNAFLFDIDTSKKEIFWDYYYIHGDIFFFNVSSLFLGNDDSLYDILPYFSLGYLKRGHPGKIDTNLIKDSKFNAELAFTKIDEEFICENCGKKVNKFTKIKESNTVFLEA